MKIWVDDVRPAPDGYIWCKSVNMTMKTIVNMHELFGFTIEVLDLDNDAGEYYEDGGDYIKILDFMEEYGLNYPIHIHSMNPVGVQNMRRIIERNGWKEI